MRRMTIVAVLAGDLFLGRSGFAASESLLTLTLEMDEGETPSFICVVTRHSVARSIPLDVAQYRARALASPWGDSPCGVEEAPEAWAQEFVVCDGNSRSGSGAAFIRLGFDGGEPPI